MKIFWWQNGLHFEPETNEEHKALAMLLDSAKVADVRPLDRSSLAQCVLSQESAEIAVADTKGSPRN
jgi:hypothetical protein